MPHAINSSIIIHAFTRNIITCPQPDISFLSYVGDNPTTEELINLIA
jgi:hypothetical protein